MRNAPGRDKDPRRVEFCARLDNFGTQCPRAAAEFVPAPAWFHPSYTRTTALPAATCREGWES